MSVFVLIDWSNLTNNYLKKQVKTIKKLRYLKFLTETSLFIN